MKETIGLGCRPLLIRYLVTSGDQYDRQVGMRLLHQLLQFETIDDRHADVSNETVDVRQSDLVLQEQLGRTERSNGIACSSPRDSRMSTSSSTTSTINAPEAIQL